MVQRLYMINSRVILLWIFIRLRRQSNHMDTTPANVLECLWLFRCFLGVD